MNREIDTVRLPSPEENLKKLVEEEKSPEMQQKMWQSVLDYKKDLIDSLKNKDTSPETLEKNLEFRRAMPTYGRSLREIAGMFNMTREQLLKEIEGKKVLNIGPGLSTFASEAKKETNTDIFSIDESEEAAKQRYDKARFIVGDASEMPAVRDDTFDIVIATVSMPHYAASREKAQKFFEEIVRVLKIGGKAMISPITRIEAQMQNLEFEVNLVDIQIGVIEEIEKLLDEGKISAEFSVRLQSKEKGSRKEFLPTAITMKKIK